MPAEVIPAVFCADYWSTFEIYSPRSKKVYLVSWGGSDTPVFCREKETGERCKGNQYHGDCWHATEVFRRGCFWNPQWYAGGTRELRPIQEATNVASGQQCPHCGGSVVGVRIAV